MKAASKHPSTIAAISPACISLMICGFVLWCQGVCFFCAASSTPAIRIYATSILSSGAGQIGSRENLKNLCAARYSIFPSSWNCQYFWGLVGFDGEEPPASQTSIPGYTGVAVDPLYPVYGITAGCVLCNTYMSLFVNGGGACNGACSVGLSVNNFWTNIITSTAVSPTPFNCQNWQSSNPIHVSYFGDATVRPLLITPNPTAFQTCDRQQFVLCACSPAPTSSPTRLPTSQSPSRSPSKTPTTPLPSKAPTFSAPTRSPSRSPSKAPSRSPSTSAPSRSPTLPKICGRRSLPQATKGRRLMLH